MELTRCDENLALVALHDCDNDVERAVDKLLEGGEEYQVRADLRLDKFYFKVIN